MTVAAVRIVFYLVAAAMGCSLTVGVPVAGKTITYDQRQNGEFNLQVDLKDIALLFLGESEFLADRSSGAAAGTFHTLERRHHDGGGHYRKKSKKCPPSTTSATTGEYIAGDKVTVATYAPEPMTENNSGGGGGAPYEPPHEFGSTPLQAQAELSHQNPVLHAKPSTTIAPESSTYQTSGVSENIFNTQSGSSAGPPPSEANVDTQTIAAKTNKPEEKPAEDNMIAVKTLDRPSLNGVVASQVSSAIREEYEKLVAKDTVGVSQVKNAGIPAEVKSQSKTEKDFTAELSSVPVELIRKDSSDVKQPVETEKAPEMVIVKTVEKPAVVESEAKPVSVGGDTKNVSENNIEKTRENSPTSVENLAKKGGESPPKLSESDVKPQETIVSRTATTKEVEKKNHETKDDNLNDSVKSGETAGPKFKQETAVKPTDNGKADMVVVKTVDKPSVSVHPKPVEVKTFKIKESEKSAVTSSPKTTETHTNAADKNTQEKPVSNENMISVKTVENPTTPSAVELSATASIVFEKKTNSNSSKTLPATTMGTSVSKKVGDRKPLPSVSIGVAPSKAVTT